MISHTTRRFRKTLAELPKPIQKQAKEAYSLFAGNPYHPGLRFKQVHSTQPIYAVRITKDYRAVGIRHDNEIIWFWIGSHSGYEEVLKQVAQPL
ncbi:MAG: hypothetical protein HY671_06630 [Chloroflexi bacterium]|nr:hypothetical protein [Chloroflexota bacterium]